MTPARDRWTLALALFGLGNVANGLWMIFDPGGWFTGIPAAVPDFGPFNHHFVRDLGSVYLTLGASLVWAGFFPAARAFAVGVTTIFYALHAAAHVWDTATGHVGAEHWWIDFPPIYLPVLVLVPAWIVLARREAR